MNKKGSKMPSRASLRSKGRIKIIPTRSNSISLRNSKQRETFVSLDSTTSKKRKEKAARSNIKKEDSAARSNIKKDDSATQEMLPAISASGIEETTRDLNPSKSVTSEVHSTCNPENEPSPNTCLLYTSPSPRDKRQSRMPSSA